MAAFYSVLLYSVNKMHSWTCDWNMTEKKDIIKWPPGIVKGLTFHPINSPVH